MPGRVGTRGRAAGAGRGSLALSGPLSQSLPCGRASGLSFTHEEVEAEGRCVEAREAAPGLRPVSLESFPHLAAQCSL